MNDSSEFKNIPAVSDKDLNYVINSEKGVTDLWQKLKNKNTSGEGTYKKLRLVASKHETPNGSAKAHKAFKSGLPPFRSIVSAIVTHTYKLEKFLIPILPDGTQNEFTVEDSSTILDEISTRDSDLCMASLDVNA